MNEEELKKGCGKAGKIYKGVKGQYWYADCGKPYLWERENGKNIPLNLYLCPTCQARLEGFQKGKLEERNRIEDLIIDMRFKIQNRLNNYFNIDTRTLLFIYNKELSQLQKEIGGMK